jgi:hypothetical protein
MSYRRRNIRRFGPARTPAAKAAGAQQKLKIAEKSLLASNVSVSDLTRARERILCSYCAVRSLSTYINTLQVKDPLRVSLDCCGSQHRPSADLNGGHGGISKRDGSSFGTPHEDWRSRLAAKHERHNRNAIRFVHLSRTARALSHEPWCRGSFVPGWSMRWRGSPKSRQLRSTKVRLTRLTVDRCRLTRGRQIAGPSSTKPNLGFFRIQPSCQDRHAERSFRWVCRESWHP